MSLDRFCRKPLATVLETDSIYSAARCMYEMHVGAVVVVDSESKPLGLLTDRDIVCRVVAQGMNPKEARVTSVMSPHPVLAKDTEPIEEAALKMQRAGVRRLPIVDPAGHLEGVVALDDITVLLAGEFAQAAHVVRENRGP